jgi:hypothetical protein
MNAATILYLVTALLGFCLLVAGVFILAGTGWALITSAASMFCIAAFVRRGLVSG